jgi:hypothetical protein
MRHRLLYVGILLVSTTLAACGTTSVQKSATTGATTTAQKPSKPTPKPKSRPQPVSLRELVAKVRSGVIRVDVDKCDAQYEGTGFLLSPRLVATVQHVVDGAVTIRLIRSGHALGTASSVLIPRAILRFCERRFPFAATTLPWRNERQPWVKTWQCWDFLSVCRFPSAEAQ